MRSNRALWVIQGLVAFVFLFAGSAKFVMSVEQMNAGPPPHFPGWFLHFIGTCEVLGAIALIVPWLTGIQPQLTPIAASLLVIIMIGAVVVTIMGGSIAGAVPPAIIGLLLIWIALNRKPGRAVLKSA